MLFKDVMVDEALKRQLVALVDENRISHAQLFLSKGGTHSFALAIAYAQYLCCEDRHDGDSCGKCHSCVMFEKLQHPDLHLIFPNCIAKDVKKDPDSYQFAQYFREFVFANNYHIDFNNWVQELNSENKEVSINIRDCAKIIQQNSIRSHENGYKIYILWMAEKLHHTAAPKLLKTLEEPENKSLFILIAENSDNILPTILSRTQLVKIPPISASVIKQHLIEEKHIPESAAEDIATIAEGNYIKALELSEEDNEIHHLLTQYNIFMRSVTSYAQKDGLQQVNYLNTQENISKISKEGKEARKQFLRYLLRMCRNELLLNIQIPELVNATKEELQCMEEYKSFFTLKNAQALLQDCGKALYHVERNGNFNLIMTDLYFKIAQHFIKK